MKKHVATNSTMRTINEVRTDPENEQNQTVDGGSLCYLQSSPKMRNLEGSLQSIRAVAVANSVARSQPALAYRSSLAVLQAVQADTHVVYASGIPRSPQMNFVPQFSPTVLDNESDRASFYEGSLRKSRLQSIYGNLQPPTPPRCTRRVSYDAYATTGNCFSDALNPIDEDERVFKESKQEIRKIKIQDVESTRNALRLAYKAFKIGTDTLGTLSEQSNRLHNAERILDQTGLENATATRKSKELNTTSRLLNFSGPFASAKCVRKENPEVLSARRQYYQDRDEVRLNAWHAWKLREARSFPSVPLGPGATRCDVEARAKYQLEPDSEDEALEDEIEDNLEETLHVVRGARDIATAQGEEIERQNHRLERMGRKMDEVGDGVGADRSRLDRRR